MADQHAIADIQSRIEYPEINHISFGDILEVLGKGFEDFRKKPSHMIFLCIFYPIIGLILVRLTFGYDIVPLLYPLIAGFALLGPLAAIGLYEISRRREAGQDVSWRHAFGIFYAPSIWSIVILGGLLMCIFFAWLLTADIIYASLFGTYQPNSPVDLLNRIVNTTEGHQLIVLGNSTGLLFAFSVFIISAISFPMLLDKHVSAATAVITSMRVIYHNPIAMLGWGLTIAVSLFLGALPFLSVLSSLCQYLVMRRGTYIGRSFDSSILAKVSLAQSSRYQIADTLYLRRFVEKDICNSRRHLQLLSEGVQPLR